MQKVKWMLAGAGDIARKRIAPALAAAKDSEIAGICDIRKEEAESLAKEHGCRNAFFDYTKALSECDADAVYLALPVFLHVPMALEALRSGKHVLVEKPLGLSAVECGPLLEEAKRKNKKAGCAYFRRFYDSYKYTANMLDQGEFGKIVSVRMVYYSWFSPLPEDPKYWRVEKRKSGGGPLSDMGTHMFDVLIGLFGLPESVYAKCGNLVNNWDVEDSSSIIMKLTGGAFATASFNWNSKTWRHEFEVVGSESKINWLPYDSGEVVKTTGRKIENLELPPAGNVHKPMVEDFVQAVIQDREPVSSAFEAFKTSILLDAIYRSAKENKEVEVKYEIPAGSRE